MKKTVAVLLLLTTVTVFFCASVSAADYQTKAIQTGTSTVDGVTISTEIIQMNAHIDSQPIYEGSAYVPYLYTTIITNNTSTNKLVYGAKVAARYQNLGTRYLGNIDNMAPDLTQSISTQAGNGWFDLLPSATFSVSSGAILVPANRSLYCVCVVYLNCEYIYNNTSQTYKPVYPAFEGDAYVRLTNVEDGSAYDFFGAGGGSSIDLSDLNTALHNYIGDTTSGDVIDYLSSIASQTDQVESYLDVIVARLNTIISNLNAWNGTIPVYSPWQSYSTSATIPSDPIGNTNWCTLYAQPSFEFSEDFEKLTNNTSYFNYTTVIPMQLTYYFKCTTTDWHLKPVESFTIDSIFKKSNGYSVIGGTLRSNFASIVRFNANSTEYNLQVFVDIDDIQYGDEFILTYDFYLVYSDTNWSYWQTGNLNTTAIYSEAVQADNSIHAQSENIVSQSNIIQQAESQWFNQNSSTLQAVGLSNYNWGGDASTGIAGVSNDFTDLFNSLGKWNAIYIFSMTLTVALTIIRYKVNGGKSSGSEQHGTKNS